VFQLLTFTSHRDCFSVLVAHHQMKNGQSESRAMLVLRSSRQLALAVGLAAPLLLLGSCRGSEKRPQAPRVSVAEIERTYGRLFAVANEPTPDQHGTGDRIGLFRDDTGTIWGIPLTIDEGGNVSACAPPTLRDAPPSDTIPDSSFEIVGAANEPTGWRGGTGKFGLLLRDARGQLSWRPVAAVDLKTGPVCLSQSEPVQPLIYYRLVRQPSSK
jgi:hypothetical protein